MNKTRHWHIERTGSHVIIEVKYVEWLILSEPTPEEIVCYYHI